MVKIKSRNGASTALPPEGGVIASFVPGDGDTAVLPAGFPLRKAAFRCRKEHLVVQAPGRPAVVIPHFFRAGGPTTIATPDGAEVSRYMVLLMLNLSDRVERALNDLATPGSGAG